MLLLVFLGILGGIVFYFLNEYYRVIKNHDQDFGSSVGVPNFWTYSRDILNDFKNGLGTVRIDLLKNIGVGAVVGFVIKLVFNALFWGVGHFKFILFVVVAGGLFYFYLKGRKIERYNNYMSIIDKAIDTAIRDLGELMDFKLSSDVYSNEMSSSPLVARDLKNYYEVYLYQTSYVIPDLIDADINRKAKFEKTLKLYISKYAQNHSYFVDGKSLIELLSISYQGAEVVLDVAVTINKATKDYMPVAYKKAQGVSIVADAMDDDLS